MTLVELTVRAMYAAAIPAALLLGLVQLGAWLFRRRPELLLWALGDLVGGTGGVLLGARKLVPAWVSFPLANTLIFVGSLFVWSGFRRWCGLNTPLRSFALATAVYYVLFHGLLLFNNDLGLRVLLASLGFALLNAAIAADLVLMQEHRPGPALRWLSGLFTIHALFYLFRAGTGLTLEADSDFLDASGIQSLSIGLMTIKLLIWNVTVLVSVLRSDEPHRAAAASP